MTNKKLKEEEIQFLQGLSSEVTSQFQKGLDQTALVNYVTNFGASQPLIASSELTKNGLPTLEMGEKIQDLSLITAATGGMSGFWVIGGEPGLGKSTLAWQIVLCVGQARSVLAYDLENGTDNILRRVGVVCKGNVPKVTNAFNQIYIRESIQTLESDLLQMEKLHPTIKCMVLVDSLQKLPTHTQFRRNSLDKWIHRLETLAKAGHPVLAISEQNRAGYGTVGMNGFKETGEIEYSASMGAQLIKNDDETIGFCIVKNRHYPNKGIVARLRRCEKRTFWFTEI